MGYGTLGGLRSAGLVALSNNSALQRLRQVYPLVTNLRKVFLHLGPLSSVVGAYNEWNRPSRLDEFKSSQRCPAGVEPLTTLSKGRLPWGWVVQWKPTFIIIFHYQGNKNDSHFFFLKKWWEQKM